MRWDFKSWSREFVFMAYVWNYFFLPCNYSHVLGHQVCVNALYFSMWCSWCRMVTDDETISRFTIEYNFCLGCKMESPGTKSIFTEQCLYYFNFYFLLIKIACGENIQHFPVKITTRDIWKQSFKKDCSFHKTYQFLAL